MGPGSDVFCGRPMVTRQGIAFDSIIAHRQSCICRGAEDDTPITCVSRQRLRPSIMLSRNCAHGGPSGPGCGSVMSGSTVPKSTACMKTVILGYRNLRMVEHARANESGSAEG